MMLSNEKIKNQAKTIKTKVFAKKALLLAITGAFIMTGIGATYLPQSVALAATPQFSHRQEHRDFDPDQMAQYMQECFGIDKQTILDYQAKGWRFKDLHRAAFIAYAGSQPLSDVLNAKTVTNSWNDVSTSFGITREQYRAAQEKLMSNDLAARLDITADAAKNLLAAGYNPRDIAMAATLSKKADKTIEAILNMKKINNTWSDVATSLGISNEAFDQCRQDAQKGFGYHKGFNGDFGKGYGHDGSRDSNFHQGRFASQTN